MEMISTKIQKARKQHVCDCCYSKIDVGEKYERQFNKMDGDIYTWKSHVSCVDLAKNLDMFRRTDEDGLTGEYFIEEVKSKFKELEPTIKGKVPFTDMLRIVKEKYLEINNNELCITN